MFDLDRDPRLTGASLQDANRSSAPSWEFPRPPGRGRLGPLSRRRSRRSSGSWSRRSMRRRWCGNLVSVSGPGRHPVTGEEAVFFPSAGTVAGAEWPSSARTAARKRAVKQLSGRSRTGRSIWGAPDFAATRQRCWRCQGVGPWSANTSASRPRRRDAFPGTEPHLKRATDLHPGLDLDAVRPWRGYAGGPPLAALLGVAQETERAMKYVHKVIDSPVGGKLKLVGNDDGLCRRPLGERRPASSSSGGVDVVTASGGFSSSTTRSRSPQGPQVPLCYPRDQRRVRPVLRSEQGLASLA